MIEVRCPGCGYVQTLSEARFMAIAEDYLTCPHCRAQVPKEWQPPSQESVPEEARHKMLAFSLRIINGGEVNRDMVYALESLVRHYAPVEGTYKALGVGYARLGEMRKAEGFLSRALSESPSDPHVLRCFLRMRLVEENYQEAVKAGRALIAGPGAQVEDEDVAGLILALLGMHRTAEANAVLEAYPHLDRRNPVVKQARRELKRVAHPGLLSFLGMGGSLNRVFKGVTSSTKAVSAASDLPPRPSLATQRRSKQPKLIGNEGHADVEKNRPTAQEKTRFPAVVEYWVYSLRSAVPRWDEIRGRMSQLYPEKKERDEALTMLESFIQKKELSTDHVYRREATTLFTYPDDLIPRNSRRLSDEDRKILSEAQIILRIRLHQSHPSDLNYLVFMTRLAEAVRELTSGVVQDAVSHTLWGTEEWKKRLEATSPADMVTSHVQFEVLDEEGVVWIHSHGMPKFGLPDIELNGIPADLAQPGLSMAILIGETLVKARERGVIHFGSALSIENSPFSFVMDLIPRDNEGHFPAGCLKILPYVSDYDPRASDTFKHVLKVFSSRLRGSRRPGGRTEDEPNVPSSDAGRQAVKERLLEAHREAKARLSAFKKSFQELDQAEASVHAVKVGFPVHGGSYEWMWVTLDLWRGTSLVGHLQNTPLVRQDLQKGCRVELNEQEIFDWVIAADGAIVNGAFTERALPSQ